MKKRNGFKRTLIGTLLSIAAAVLFTLIMSGISRLVFMLRFGERPVMALLSNSVTYIIIAFVAYEIVYFVWLFNAMSEEKNKKETALSEKKQSGIKMPVKIAGLIALAISVIMVFANCMIYTEISEDCITEKTLFSKKEYSVEDVYRYSLSCDIDGRLKFTVWTEDGNTFELFEGANTISDAFTEKYGGGLLHFARVLSDKYDASEIYVEKVISESTLTYLERYYNNGDSVWEDIKGIIE